MLLQVYISQIWSNMSESQDVNSQLREKCQNYEILMKFWLFSQLVIASLYLTVLTLLLAIVSWEKSQNCEMQICAKNSEWWEKKLQLPFFFSLSPFFHFFHSVAETDFYKMYSEQVQMCFVCVICHCTVQMCNGVAKVYNSCSRKAVSAAENNVFCVQMQEMTERRSSALFLSVNACGGI